ncbi:ATP-binding protein [Saprospiraceae bacterium]|nr:ATP-binding protein [Saprospiraceae bacterium]
MINEFPIIERDIKSEILSNLKKNKVVVLLGPRRVGKTILINQIKEEINESYLIMNGEDFDVHAILNNRSIRNYKNMLSGYKLLIIDEAQNIPEIGSILKLMIDNVDGLKILITRSSVIDISNKTGEPLTGRKIDFQLFAFSENEFNQVENLIEKKANLRSRLIYGNYPELIHLSTDDQKSEYLKEIINSYLLKDILAFENIRNTSKILSLLKLVAFQIGNEVSMQELGVQLSMSKNTVSRYLDLLSKVFVLYEVKGFSRNLRKEITKNSKWYFYDNGLRNLLIANTNPLELRNDMGQLWENYILSERIKFQKYNNILSNNYFWRTYDQQEIDWIEDRGGSLYAYEIKWNVNSKNKKPKAWEVNYKESEFVIIHPDNYLDWVT